MQFRGTYRNGNPVVLKNREVLTPDASRRILDLNPDGFEWGHNGSGPSQLALALLLESTGNPTMAKNMYFMLKGDVISKLSREWIMSQEFLQAWVSHRLDPILRSYEP